MTRAERQDREANEFAMELLMPAELLRAKVKRPVSEQNIVALAKEFEVSEIVMTVRLMRLRLIR